MATVVLDDALAKRLRAERAACGGDRYDEVWEGTYMMAPMPNNEHQQFVSRLTRIFDEVVGDANLGTAYSGVNVSDRVDDWEHNYRVPDVAVFLNDSAAVDHGNFWFGGPDFAVEVLSPGDKSREKLGFYARVHTRELLVIDRQPWRLELYKLASGRLVLAAGDGSFVVSGVLELNFQLTPPASEGQRPGLEVSHIGTARNWTI